MRVSYQMPKEPDPVEAFLNPVTGKSEVFSEPPNSVTNEIRGCVGPDGVTFVKSVRISTDNPKKAFGDQKPCLHFVPAEVLLSVAEVMRLGASKYGLKNWREQPVRASTYYDAMFRHMVAWFETREDKDVESGQHHLAHAICCAMIILDGLHRGTFVDDRGEQEVKTRNVGEHDK
jgi:hypothetical protein